LRVAPEHAKARVNTRKWRKRRTRKRKRRKRKRWIRK
jgi:hypothetical protein